MVNIIWFWVDLIRYRKYFSGCIKIKYPWNVQIWLWVKYYTRLRMYTKSFSNYKIRKDNSFLNYFQTERNMIVANVFNLIIRTQRKSIVTVVRWSERQFSFWLWTQWKSVVTVVRWSYWRFSFWLWTQWKSAGFIINRKTVPTSSIIFLSSWK